jgi:altronate dehydratase small subunit
MREGVSHNRKDGEILSNALNAQHDSSGVGTRRSGSTAETSLLLLDGRDTVAVAMRDLAAGEVVTVGGYTLEVRDPIPVGHKIALTRMPRGAPVTKYGEVIGVATADIDRGAHVHVHNVVSARLPGPGS